MVNDLSKRVENLISAKNVSKVAISKELGIGYSTLWRRLNGSRNVNVDFLTKLANILGTTPSYLMGETDNPSRNNDMNVSSEVKQAKEQTGMLSFAYWRDVFNAAQDIADSGDKDAITYVSQILNRALSLLVAKSDNCALQNSFHDISAVTSSQVILGNNNASNLTVTKQN